MVKVIEIFDDNELLDDDRDVVVFDETPFGQHMKAESTPSEDKRRFALRRNRWGAW